MHWFLIIHLLSGEVITPGPLYYPNHDACQNEAALLNLNPNVKIAFCVYGEHVK